MGTNIHVYFIIRALKKNKKYIYNKNVHIEFYSMLKLYAEKFTFEFKKCPKSYNFPKKMLWLKCNSSKIGFLLN